MMTKPNTLFTRQVKDALHHVYDVAHLSTHPFADELVETDGSDLDRARALRKILLETIEALQPGAQVPYTAPEWRPYRVCLGRYVQHAPLLDICQELGISERQYQREHRRGLLAIGNALWQRRERQAAAEASAHPPRTVSNDTEHMLSRLQQESLDLGQLVQGVLSSVSRLAQEQKIEITTETRGTPQELYGDRGLFRQVLFNILNDCISSTQAGHLVLRIESEPTATTVSFAWLDRDEPHKPFSASPRLERAQDLAQAAGGVVEIEGSRLRLKLPTQRSTLLCIDDNDDLVQLIRRYLAGESIDIRTTGDAAEALRLASELRPALITLDVMMPSHDGWEILQSLKHHPETSDIPVAICSILDEADLASSLGADDYLIKPITQASLLQLVRRWL